MDSSIASELIEDDCSVSVDVCSVDSAVSEVAATSLSSLFSVDVCCVQPCQ
ncbi:hypothetical protein [Tetragenococcus halophilus]|uniref:hypothetical protein n=1 Tax=Tetragenococcus halophilus TaxID=51669 RepID=UPI0030EE346E